MLKPEYPITTERLTLRPFTHDDLDAIHAYSSRPDVARYLYWEPRDRAAAQTYLDKAVNRTTINAEGDIIDLAVTRNDTGQTIGSVLLILTSHTHRQGEIGYILHPGHHGHGYATEAAREMLRLGFDDLHLHRIIGRLDARNTASARVLEKLGMRREAHLVENEHVKGEWCDEAIYAMLRREWQAR
ncbi:GNAT family N-acetyltransferase [Nonomuraea soli]|uniref:RimJ/RimL family protein N-acetyltransferase n=1 Tax=Nonomuraea soli TaxID=1032476 RepID=A0A7W0CH71_9ACTN|nr:GNAT family protein [Nonomuraea soli]MBA2891162.1 RimJ/RimL family protein N-acetyltransferase [Nonomuraea soli]